MTAHALVSAFGLIVCWVVAVVGFVTGEELEGWWRR